MCGGVCSGELGRRDRLACARLDAETEDPRAQQPQMSWRELVERRRLASPTAGGSQILISLLGKVTLPLVFNNNKVYIFISLLG